MEQLLSQVYVLLLSQFVRVFTQGLPTKAVNGLMREAGKGLAKELLEGKRPASPHPVARMRRLTNAALGA